MSRRVPPARLPLRVVAFLPFVLVGVAIGLAVLLVVMSWKPKAFDPLDEADTADPPMVVVPGGSFVMGSDTGPDDERPTHTVTVRTFQMDATEVTNAQFARFVKATGYKTVAERLGGSARFVPVKASLDRRDWDTPHPPWWKYEPGANWLHPDGPSNTLIGKMNHPVVQIAWTDAAAYAKWAGKRLPTEAEWEYAARGGLERAEFCWGSESQGAGGVWRANTFQGEFPHADNGADGFAGTSPVRNYTPNGYGLYDMSGNVWEWCSDWYQPDYYRHSPSNNPPGPDTGAFDFGQPQRVRRGGSFLCADGYCRRYLPAARDKNPEDSGASHTGFRCVRD